MTVSKVFGTGLHRTATTSLHHALEGLGFRSIHAPFSLFEDVSHDVIAKYDAFTDLPVPLCYQVFDRAFPDAKFVHTIRDEDDWLTSARWLFEEGRYRFHWDSQPIVAKVHEALYGQADFDEEVFRERYRRHNAEVMRYFEDRPGKLLTMDITAGDGWETLSPFLGRAVPEQVFPSSKARPPMRSLVSSLQGRILTFFHSLVSKRRE